MGIHINKCITTYTVGDTELDNFFIMQGKLDSLVKTVKNVVKSAIIDVGDLKKLLTLYYPFEEEIQKAKNLSDVFVVVRKLCSPINIHVPMLIVCYFKFSDAETAIQAYETEEQNYRKKLSTTFAQEIQKEVELIGHNPTIEHYIDLKLKWSSNDSVTFRV